MLVKLQRNWLAPDGHLYRADRGGTEVPDRFKEVLPSQAKILNQKGKAELSEDDLIAAYADEFSSDSAAQKAVEAGLSPEDIRGTGSGGRITVKDVDKVKAQSEGVLAKDAGTDRQAQAAVDKVLKQKKA